MFRLTWCVFYIADGSGDAKVKVSEKAAADIAKFNGNSFIITIPTDLPRTQSWVWKNS